MSDLESKLEQQRSTEGRAQRTYASLERARGFHITRRPQPGAPARVRIIPMDGASDWEHIGNGRWDAAGALYEKVEEA